MHHMLLVACFLAIVIAENCTPNQLCIENCTCPESVPCSNEEVCVENDGGELEKIGLTNVRILEINETATQTKNLCRKSGDNHSFVKCNSGTVCMQDAEEPCMVMTTCQKWTTYFRSNYGSCHGKKVIENHVCNGSCNPQQCCPKTCSDQMRMDSTFCSGHAKMNNDTICSEQGEKPCTKDECCPNTCTDVARDDFCDSIPNSKLRKDFVCKTCSPTECCVVSCARRSIEDCEGDNKCWWKKTSGKCVDITCRQVQGICYGKMTEFYQNSEKVCNERCTDDICCPTPDEELDRCKIVRNPTGSSCQASRCVYQDGKCSLPTCSGSSASLLVDGCTGAKARSLLMKTKDHVCKNLACTVDECCKLPPKNGLTTTILVIIGSSVLFLLLVLFAIRYVKDVNYRHQQDYQEALNAPVAEQPAWKDSPKRKQHGWEPKHVKLDRRLKGWRDGEKDNAKIQVNQSGIVWDGKSIAHDRRQKDSDQMQVNQSEIVWDGKSIAHDRRQKDNAKIQVNQSGIVWNGKSIARDRRQKDNAKMHVNQSEMLLDGKSIARDRRQKDNPKMHVNQSEMLLDGKSIARDRRQKDNAKMHVNQSEMLLDEKSIARDRRQKGWRDGQKDTVQKHVKGKSTAHNHRWNARTKGNKSTNDTASRHSEVYAIE